MTTPSTKRGRLSADERQQIEDLAGKGWKAGRIALKLERHRSTIVNALYRFGLLAPRLRQPMIYHRKGRIVRTFSRDEDVFIEALRVQDYGPKRIADIAALRFGYRRPVNSISIRLRMLANRAEGVI